MGAVPGSVRSADRQYPPPAPGTSCPLLSPDRQILPTSRSPVAHGDDRRHLSLPCRRPERGAHRPWHGTCASKTNKRRKGVDTIRPVRAGQKQDDRHDEYMALAMGGVLSPPRALALPSRGHRANPFQSSTGAIPAAVAAARRDHSLHCPIFDPAEGVHCPAAGDRTSSPCRGACPHDQGPPGDCAYEGSPKEPTNRGTKSSTGSPTVAAGAASATPSRRARPDAPGVVSARRSASVSEKP